MTMPTIKSERAKKLVLPLGAGLAMSLCAAFVMVAALPDGHRLDKPVTVAELAKELD